MIKQLFKLKEFFCFVAVGALAAIANMVSRYFLDFVMVFELAVLIAYVIGMVIAFVLFQKLIFGAPDTPVKTRIFRFCVVNAVGAVLAVLVSSLMARVVFPSWGWTFHPAEIAHFIGVSVPAISSYFGHKLYTYK